jgi:hypothetical protein
MLLIWDWRQRLVARVRERYRQHQAPAPPAAPPARYVGHGPHLEPAPPYPTISVPVCDVHGRLDPEEELLGRREPGEPYRCLYCGKFVRMVDQPRLRISDDLNLLGGR